jgi:serine phosphatase RsbU (regulator of sigma subunit)
MFQSVGSKKGMSETLNNKGKILFEKGYVDVAQSDASRAMKLAQELGFPVLISDAASLLFDIYKKKGDWKNAMEMKELHASMKDSILNSETQKATMRQQMKYEFEKQEALAKLEAERKAIVQEEEKKRQRILLFTIIGVLALMVIFAGFIYNRYRVSRRQQKIIEQQKKQVDLAFDQLSEKNREIIDSIHYARRIQTALLKEEEHISKHLPEHFILFKPKDIVSGDFYWSHEREGYWYLAAADCTGHGVPGAFLTMLGTSFLNEVVSSTELLSPAQILDRLRDKIVKELSQSSKDDAAYNHALVKDGMDVSLMRLHLESLSIEWAGANNGFLIYRSSADLNDQGFEKQKDLAYKYLSPDKQPIGYYHNSKPFVNHTFKGMKGDTYYLCTDGYADQFGGPQGKKLKFRALQEQLLELQSHDMNSQKKILGKKFDDWKGNLEQVDDVTLIGVRI